MKYNNDDAFNEIKKRGAKIRRKREQKITGILSAATALCVISLVVAISAFSGTRVSEAQTMYSSFVLSAETGGYVLVAVMGFVMGVVVTFLISHFKKEKSNKQ